MKFKFNSRNDGVHIPIKNSESSKQMMAFGKQESGALQKRILLNLRIRFRSLKFVWKKLREKNQIFILRASKAKKEQKKKEIHSDNHDFSMSSKC